MSELKPCPFCGGGNVHIIDYEFTDQVECDECGNLVRPRYWNSRPIEDEPGADNERLEQRIRELEEAQSTLTEQLRLANEDADRLATYVKHKRTCTWKVIRSDVTPRCGCKLSDAMYLHKKRITQESE